MCSPWWLQCSFWWRTNVRLTDEISFQVADLFLCLFQYQYPALGHFHGLWKTDSMCWKPSMFSFLGVLLQGCKVHRLYVYIFFIEFACCSSFILFLMYHVIAWVHFVQPSIIKASFPHLQLSVHIDHKMWYGLHMETSRSVWHDVSLVFL